MSTPTAFLPSTLPQRYYTDENLFREELERFYFGQWISAGREETIPNPGDYFLCDVAGESVIVLRDQAGNARAYYNVCRHRGTRLCTEAKGTFRGRVQCSYHGWTYALDGQLIGAPHMDSAFDRSEYPLRSVNTAAWDGHLFLNFSSRPEPLPAQLGDLPEKFAHWRMAELRLHKRIEYDVQANWKLLVANYNECLHCPLIHPALNRLTDYLGSENEPGSRHYVGGAMGFRNGAQTMSTDGERRRAFLPGLDEAERTQVCYYAIYPNFLLSLHPDYMMVHRLWPRSVDRTAVVCEWYFHPDEMAKAGFQADDAIEFWDRTNREDWAIVEQSQAGIRSRAYSPGPYSAREELLYEFDREVLLREHDHS